MSANAANLVFQNNMGSTPLGTRIYDYTTSDNLSDVEEFDPDFGAATVYFSANGCSDKLRTYDFIRVTANDGKALYFVGSAGPDFVQIHKIATVTSFN